MKMRILFIGLLALGGLLDIITTIAGLQIGLSEANPAMQYLMQNFEIAGWATLKIGLTALIGVAAWHLWPHFKTPWSPTPLWLAVAATWWAAIQNYLIIIGAR